MWGVELLVMLGMVAFNSVFAAFEIALASISAARLHSLAVAHRPGAAAAEYMKRNLEGSLAGVQLGITLVGAIAAAVGGAGAEEAIAPSLQSALRVSSGTAEVIAIALVVAPLTVVTIIFGELIPKVFALRNKEWVCLRLSPPMKWFVTAVRPVVWALEKAVTGLMSLGERHLKGRLGQGAKTEAAELQELRASVALARTSRLIGPREEKIILGAAALSQRPIREVMLPAAAINMLDLNASLADALIAAHLDMHTRFPVTERAGDPQRIVGYVNVKDIMAQMRLAPDDPSVRAITRAIPSVADDVPVSDSTGAAGPGITRTSPWSATPAGGGGRDGDPGGHHRGAARGYRGRVRPAADTPRPVRPRLGGRRGRHPGPAEDGDRDRTPTAAGRGPAPGRLGRRPAAGRRARRRRDRGGRGAGGGPKGAAAKGDGGPGAEAAGLADMTRPELLGKTVPSQSGLGVSGLLVRGIGVTTGGIMPCGFIGGLIGVWVHRAAATLEVNRPVHSPSNSGLHQ